MSFNGCCHTNKNITGCDYSPASAFVACQNNSKKSNIKLQKKLEQIDRKINAWEDYSDTALVVLLKMNKQRSDYIENIVSNEKKFRQLMEKSDSFHGVKI